MSLAIRQSYFLILLEENGDDKHQELPFKGSKIKLRLSAFHNILLILQKSSNSLKPWAQRREQMNILYKLASIKVLTTEKNWQHRHIQEYNDADVAETKVEELL